MCDQDGTSAYHQSREKAVVYLITIKPEQLGESKLIYVCFCQGDNFYPWLWACNWSNCPFSFIWLTAKSTLAETFFLVPCVSHPLFFNLHFPLFLSRDPSLQRAAPKCYLWFVWQCMAKSKRGAKSVLANMQLYNDFLPRSLMRCHLRNSEKMTFKTRPQSFVIMFCTSEADSAP